MTYTYDEYLELCISDGMSREDADELCGLFFGGSSKKEIEVSDYEDDEDDESEA